MHSRALDNNCEMAWNISCYVYTGSISSIGICDSAWEKVPYRAYFQNRAITTVVKSRL